MSSSSSSEARAQDKKSFYESLSTDELLCLALERQSKSHRVTKIIQKSINTIEKQGESYRNDTKLTGEAFEALLAEQKATNQRLVDVEQILQKQTEVLQVLIENQTKKAQISERATLQQSEPFESQQPKDETAGCFVNPFVVLQRWCAKSTRSRNVSTYERFKRGDFEADDNQIEKLE